MKRFARSFSALTAALVLLSLSLTAYANPVPHKGDTAKAKVSAVTASAQTYSDAIGKWNNSDEPTPNITLSPRLAAYFNRLDKILDVAPGAGALNYPTGADNADGVWATTGPSAFVTVPLVGLVANTPVNIIAAVPGRSIVIVAVAMCSNVAGSTVGFQDETGTPVVYSGKFTFPANGFILLPYAKCGYMTFPVNTPVDIAITGTSDVVGGTVTYYLK